MKKPAKKKQEMFGYAVDIVQDTNYNQYRTEQYGNWNKESTNTVQRLVKKTDQYPDIVSTLDIPSGTNALVVWVQWTSGDSFGRHKGGCTEAIGIFTDMLSAEQLRAHIENKNWYKDHELNFTTDDGQTFECGFVGWSGYFDSLDFARIDVVTVFK